MKFNIDAIDLPLPVATPVLSEFCERLSGKRIPDEHFRDCDGGLFSDGKVIARTELGSQYSICMKHRARWKVIAVIPAFDPTILAIKDNFLSIVDTRRVETAQKHAATLKRIEEEREQEAARVRERSRLAHKRSVAASHKIHEYHESIGLSSRPGGEMDDEVRTIMQRESLAGLTSGGSV